MEKLKILADSAKYDVSCSSSGSNRRNNGKIGSAHASGICHSWGADGRCISLLKILFTNKCEYDCEYCINRRSNDFPRASFEPNELAELTIEFYRRNYIEGLFVSSAVERSPDYTAERILECIRLLRNRYGFAGYIHAKIIPGVSPEIVHMIGLEADRVSVNIEMPDSGSLNKFAPQKKPKAIFAPMRQITNSLIERNALAGPGNMFRGQKINSAEHYLTGRSDEIQRTRQGIYIPARSSASSEGRNIMTGNDPMDPKGKGIHHSDDIQVPDPAGRNSLNKKAVTEQTGFSDHLPDQRSVGKTAAKGDFLRTAAAEPRDPAGDIFIPSAANLPEKRRRERDFAPAGQTTQMIIGAGGDTDQGILTTSENLYRTFKLKRVYYSAYVPVVDSPVLPDRKTAPPLAREHRIYQADWLLRFYGFTVSELFGKGERNLDPDLDPKVMWALRNLEYFPVEVNKASWDMLMRIPGIGAVSARRIIRQRKIAAVRSDDLKKMGVVMKRAKYFLTCCGRYYGEKKFEPETIRNSLLQMEDGLQLSMFDNNWNRIGSGERQEKLSAAGII